MNDLALFLKLAIQVGTPMLYGTLGGILCEKAGHLNLGIEGMMLLGASFGFATAFYSGSVPLAIAVAALAGGLGALLYAIVTVTFHANQTVTGFAITILGTGIANFSGRRLSNVILPKAFIDSINTNNLTLLKKIPFLGTMLFSHSYYVHAGIIVAILLYIYMNKTRPGLAMRMVGEDPAAADASGINVLRYKYLHIVTGGCLCGLGGAYLSLVYVPRWQDNITAGMGWIAVALVIFATWNPLKAIGGAYLFGILKGISIKYQNVSFNILGLDISISSQIMDMIPYVMTICVLVFTTLSKKRENQAPQWLGQSYFREDR